MDTLIVRVGEPTDPQIAAILDAHIAHGDAHYPTESNHHIGAADYVRDKLTILGAWNGARCVGTIGLKPLADGSAEVKSMHVLADSRGRGAGRALIAALVALARERGMSRLWLETGSLDASASARRLYESAGFTYCPPFGSYRPDPFSMFMTRRI